MKAPGAPLAALLAAVLAAVTLAPRMAHAQLAPEDPEGRIEHPLDQGSMDPGERHSGEPIGHRIGIELGVYDGRLASGHFAFALLGMVSARLVLAPTWHLDVAMPFAFSYQEFPVVDGTGAPTGTTASDGEIRTGNPYAAVALVPELGGGWRTRFSLGVAVPAAQLSDVLGLDAFLAGLESNGAASRWLWMPSVLSIVLLADVEHDLGTNVVLGGRLAGATSFCVDSRCGHVFDTPLEAMVFVATKLRDDDESRAGLRLRVAAMPTSDTEATQFSLEPYVHMRIERFYVDARFTMNLDDPYGFAFDRRGAWGIFAGAGVVN